MSEFSGLDRRDELNSVRGCPQACGVVLQRLKQNNGLEARTTGESMFEKKNDELLHDHNHDGIDRRDS
jgi:hypothetical protein